MFNIAKQDVCGVAAEAIQAKALGEDDILIKCIIRYKYHTIHSRGIMFSQKIRARGTC